MTPLIMSLHPRDWFSWCAATGCDREIGVRSRKAVKRVDIAADLGCLRALHFCKRKIQLMKPSENDCQVGRQKSDLSRKLRCHEPLAGEPSITVPPLPPGYLCAAVRREAREEVTGTTCWSSSPATLCVVWLAFCDGMSASPLERDSTDYARV